MNCKKCDFSKFIYIGNKIPEDLIEVIPNFCPQCGEKVQSEPELPWWCVPGMCIVNKTIPSNISIINESDLVGEGLLNIIKNYKPFGGPFDMIPKEATNICFEPDGSGYFIIKNYMDLRPFPIWDNCPEEFKGIKFSLEGLE